MNVEIGVGASPLVLRSGDPEKDYLAYKNAKMHLKGSRSKL